MNQKLTELLHSMHSQLGSDPQVAAHELELLAETLRRGYEYDNSELDDLELQCLELLLKALQAFGYYDLARKLELCPAGCLWDTLVELQTALPEMHYTDNHRITIALEYLMRVLGMRKNVQFANGLTTQVELLKHLWFDVIPRVIREAEIAAETQRSMHNLRRQLLLSCKELLIPIRAVKLPDAEQRLPTMPPAEPREDPFATPRASYATKAAQALDSALAKKAKKKPAKKVKRSPS